MSMFDKYSLQAISTIVEELYRRILASENLAPYFVGVNMNKLRVHQAEFISHIMGGPISYTGKELSLAHRRLNIKDQDFAEVARILETTLLDCGVEPGDVAQLMSLVAGQRSSIIS